jgi:protein tyrosine phosphatase (PTP) superfamily phosphohydrolase (DUF442 family)
MKDRSFLWAATALLAIGTISAGDARGQERQRGSSLHVQQLDEGIYFGPAPMRRADFVKLRQLGVRRIIDVRSYAFVASLVESRRAAAHGMDYQRIPTSYDPIQSGSVPSILAELTRTKAGAVYLHCQKGRDRTGMLVAIYRTEQLGWTSQDAWRWWKSNQFNRYLVDLDRYFWQRVARRPPGGGA